MSEIESIADQLKRAFEGHAWHGPSIMEILGDVNAKQAASRPSSAVHSIWEVALHIAAWERAGVMRLNGERAELKSEEDWPTVNDTGDEAWKQTLKTLRDSNHELRSAISRLDEARLHQPIVEGMSSAYVTLHGIIQHDLYHAGQLSLLKKLTTEAARYE
jgi:uncharacterized damage-inducible protein DinB